MIFSEAVWLRVLRSPTRSSVESIARSPFMPTEQAFHLAERERTGNLDWGTPRTWPLSPSYQPSEDSPLSKYPPPKGEGVTYWHWQLQEKCSAGATESLASWDTQLATESGDQGSFKASNPLKVHVPLLGLLVTMTACWAKIRVGVARWVERSAGWTAHGHPGTPPPPIKGRSVSQTRRDQVGAAR